MKPARVHLDYLTPRPRARWPGILVLALSLALAGELVTRYDAVRRELAGLEAAASLAGPRERPPARALSRERLDEAVRDAEAVVRRLALPWATLVRALERASTRDVALLQLQPDADARLVKLTAEARHRAAMFDYVRRLASTEGLSEVHVVSHEVQVDDPQRPVQFAVQASMKAMR